MLKADDDLRCASASVECVTVNAAVGAALAGGTVDVVGGPPG
jgi:hypothetical protein